MSLAHLNGSPRTVTLGGEAYQIYPLTLSDHGDLQGWLEDQLPDPMEAVRKHCEKHKPSMEVQKYLYRTALEEASKTRIFLHSPEAMSYLNAPAGVIEILYLSIRKGRTGFTRDDAKRLLGGLTAEDIAAVMQKTELDLVLADDDPKAEMAGSTNGTGLEA